MKTFVALFCLISMVAFPLGGEGCKCSPATSEEVTRWGGNHWVVNKPGGKYKAISGKVVMWVDEKPMDEALVEVFDKPDYLLCEWEPNNPHGCTTKPPVEQRRVAACTTGKDGRFCFSNIPAGKYELRVSKDGSWNVVHAYVVVVPNTRVSNNEGIVIEMTVGD